MRATGVWASQQGAPGKSAYDSYRETTDDPLSEAAWVESLHGGQGLAISGVDILTNGQLQQTLSDGSQIVAEGYARPTMGMGGSVVRWSYDGGKTWIEGNDVRGPKGSDGEQGPAGPRGLPGSNGRDGVDGQTGKDGIVPVYNLAGELWKGVVMRQYIATVDGNGQWSVDYTDAGFTSEPIVSATPWYSGTSAADQCVVSYASRSTTAASGRAVRGISGSLLGLSSTWRFVPSGTPITVVVTGPTEA